MRSSTALKLTAVVALIVLSAICALAQPAQAQAPADTLSGKYEGTAKSAAGEAAPVTLELKREGAKITGRVVAAQTTAEISEGTLTDGTLTLKFVGRAGVITAKVDGDKITGEWLSDSRKGTIDLKKVVAEATNAATAPINLTGEWEGVADAQGQPFPFTLVLKIDGEKVTGSSSSQLGESQITSGTWKDGKLNFTLEGQNGVIAMIATVIDGKLSGEFDFAGQLTGKWVAVRKK